jgi:hypothetical protein
VSTRLPEAFCWTRFGTEAGERIEKILERKEAERLSCSGVFFWGIGNSVAPAIAELLRQTDRPEVLFSPLRSRPRQVDVTPGRVVRWTAGETRSGRFELPPGARVTSRRETSSRRPHYALVCSSAQALAFGDFGQLDFYSLRNLIRGTRLGASQVTAVVKRLPRADVGGPSYPVALRAVLVEPYFLRLREFEVITDTGAGL